MLQNNSAATISSLSTDSKMAASLRVRYPRVSAGQTWGAVANQATSRLTSPRPSSPRGRPPSSIVSRPPTSTTTSCSTRPCPTARTRGRASTRPWSRTTLLSPCTSQVWNINEIKLSHIIYFIICIFRWFSTQSLDAGHDRHRLHLHRICRSLHLPDVVSNEIIV